MLTAHGLPGLLLVAAAALSPMVSVPALVEGQSAAATAEVLVLTSATQIPALGGRKAVEVQNRGPNSIFCALASSGAAVVNRAREVKAGDAWALDAPDTLSIWCIAATAAQVTGAATIVTQLPR